MTLQVQQGFCRFPLNHASESPRRDPKLWRNAFAGKILQRSWTQPGPSAAAYFKQGLVFMDQGKLQSAIVCLNEAIQLDPQYGEA